MCGYKHRFNVQNALTEIQNVGLRFNAFYYISRFTKCWLNVDKVAYKKINLSWLFMLLVLILRGPVKICSVISGQVSMIKPVLRR